MTCYDLTVICGSMRECACVCVRPRVRERHREKERERECVGERGRKGKRDVVVSYVFYYMFLLRTDDFFDL